MQNICLRPLFSLYLNLVLFLVVISFAGLSRQSLADPVLREIKPLQAIFGKSSRLPMNLPDWQAQANIVVGGGGPYQDGELQLDAEVVGLAQYHSLTIVASAEQKLLVIDWQAQPARVIQALKLNAKFQAMKVAQDHLWLVENGKAGTLAVFSIAEHGLQAAGKLETNAAITDFSVDDKYVLALLDQQRVLSADYSVSTAGQIQFTQTQSHALTTPAQTITHQGQQVIVASQVASDNIHKDKTKAQKSLALYRFDQGRLTLQQRQQNAGNPGQLLISKDQLIVADGRQGVSIYALAENGLQWLGGHSKLGEVDQVWRFQNRLIINNAQQRLASLKLDDPSLPITGSIFKPDMPIDHAASDDGYVYVAWQRRLQRIDYRLDGATQISNEGINLGGTRRAYVKDQIAYVADWFSGLHIYDMRNPQMPRHLGNYHTPGSSKGVVVDKGIAYVADDDHGLQLIDVSNPAQPKLISHIASTGLAYTLKLYKKRVYLADHRGGFHIIDVSNPKQPKEISHFDTPGKSWAIAVKNQYVFVADDQSGLLVFDLSDIRKPKEIAQYQPGGYAEDLEIHGNIAYVSFFDQGLHIIDISRPNRLKRIAAIAIPGNARSVEVKQKRAYIAGWESGLQIVDLSNLKQPRLLASLDTNGSTWGVDVEGDYAYLWDWWGGVKVADISDPANPSLIGQYQGGGKIMAMASDDHYAFLAQGDRGLQVFDIINPDNPIWMTGMDLPGYAASVSIGDKRAFVGLDNAGIAIVDIANPFQLKRIGYIPINRSIRQLAYRDGKLMIATGDDQILTYRVHTAAPSLQSRLYQPLRQWAQNNKHWVFSSADGVQGFIDATPNSKRFHYLPGQGFSALSLAGDLLAACDDHGKVHLLKVHADHFEKLIAIDSGPGLLSVLLQNQTLYINNQQNGVSEYVINETHQVKLVAHYRATGPDQNMLHYQDTLLFSGGNTLNSLPLIPELSVTDEQDGSQLQIPAGLDLGYYHLWISRNGKDYFYPNSLHVGLKRARKPAMSMEKFKQLMQQHLNKSKAEK